MVPDSNTEILLNGGPLNQLYRFAEMHLHWGELDVCGCEHTLDGGRFAAELHLVHWNTGYGEQPQAMDKGCLLYTSPSPRDGLLSRMPSSA